MAVRRYQFDRFSLDAIGGSLSLVGDSFPDARLHLDPLGTVLGPFAASVTNALEAAWFSLCLVGALMRAALSETSESSASPRQERHRAPDPS
jgi:hypothetical protein